MCAPSLPPLPEHQTGKCESLRRRGNRPCPVCPDIPLHLTPPRCWLVHIWYLNESLVACNMSGFSAYLHGCHQKPSIAPLGRCTVHAKTICRASALILCRRRLLNACATTFKQRRG